MVRLVDVADFDLPCLLGLLQGHRIERKMTGSAHLKSDRGSSRCEACMHDVDVVAVVRVSRTQECPKLADDVAIASL